MAPIRMNTNSTDELTTLFIYAAVGFNKTRRLNPPFNPTSEGTYLQPDVDNPRAPIWSGSRVEMTSCVRVNDHAQAKHYGAKGLHKLCFYPTHTVDKARVTSSYGHLAPF